MSMPQPWPGTDAEREANRSSHQFGSEDRCWDCDCRPWGTLVDWPCGATVPRVPLSEDALIKFELGFLAYAVTKETQDG